MISNCIFDQAELNGNHCLECNRLFFDPKDIVVIEIDIDQYLTDIDREVIDSMDQSILNQFIFRSVADQWRSADTDQPFLIGSAKLLTKVTRHIVTNDHSRWNIEEVPNSNDLLICEGHHEKMEPCEYDRYRPVSEDDHDI